MEERNDKRQSSPLSARLWGLGATLLFHICLFTLVGFSSLTYLYPPPEEKTLLIEFEELEVKKPKPRYGTAPKTPKPDSRLTEKVVKASEAQEIGSKPNEAMESTMGEEGDVAKEEPKRPEINRKSLFASADNEEQKDTLASQTAFKRSDQLSAGHAAGNSESGPETGEPVARLEGRNVKGLMPRPQYPNINKEGIVVVRITVKQDGNVHTAIAGVEGTTVVDKQLWTAARTAAMKTHFNQDGRAEPLQEGTITYVFKLK